MAGLQLGLVDQHPVGGEVRQAVGGGLLPRQVPPAWAAAAGPGPCRTARTSPRSSRSPRSAATARRAGPGRGPRGPRRRPGCSGRRPRRRASSAYALADLPHDPGGVRAADVVVLRVVAEDRDRLAERRPHVVEVHAGGHHAHHHLEGAGLRYLHLLELEGLDRLALALLADDPGGHRGGELAGLGRELGDLAVSTDMGGASTRSSEPVVALDPEQCEQDRGGHHQAADAEDQEVGPWCRCCRPASRSSGRRSR